MKKVLITLMGVFFLATPLTAFAADPALSFPMREGSNAEAHKHNEEGIMHYNLGHFDVALKHFSMASKIDPKAGEAHYNEALCLDALGKHGDAAKHDVGRGRDAAVAVADAEQSGRGSPPPDVQVGAPSSPSSLPPPIQLQSIRFIQSAI